MKYILKGLIFIAFLVSLKSYAQIGPLPCGAVSSITTWRQDYAYSIGQVVILDGVTYQSITNNNLNQNPCTYQGSQWNNVIAAGLSPVQSITTVGNSGPATLSTNGVLNIPQYIISPGVISNGVTATTQNNGDNSNQLATDAFVLANAGSGNLPSAPAAGYIPVATGAGPNYSAQPTQAVPLGTAISGTNYSSNELEWNGSYWNGSTALIDTFACQDIVTPGTNPYTLLNCFHSGSPGGNEIQFDTGVSIIGPLQVSANGGQTITTDVQPTFFPNTTINYLDGRFYADGFLYSGAYSGVGQATIAFSSSVDAPTCQSVSYSGSYYLAMSSPNHTITPGTDINIWWPIPNSGATTPLDCAWYMAEGYKHNEHRNSLVVLGNGTYNTNGLVDLVDGSSYDDENSVGLDGAGQAASYILYTGSTATPVINRPTGGANFAPMLFHDITVDGGGLASAAIEVGSFSGSFFNISAGHVAPGSDHVLEFAHYGGDGFQVFPEWINIGIYPDSGTQNCGVFTANVVGGSVTSYTVNNGGDCYLVYSGSPPASITVVSLRGYKGGTSNQPCTVMPTGQVATIVGNAVTAISEGTNSGGSGCSGTIDVQVYQTENVNYGAILNNSDSTAKDITSYSGAIAAFSTGAGDTTYIHLHPSVVPNGIIAQSLGNTYVGTELDDIGGCGFEIQYPFTYTGLSISGTNGYVGGDRRLPGSATYCFASNTNAVTGSSINISASSALVGACIDCGGITPPDWQEFVTPSGTINSPADYLSKTPSGLSVLGNDTSVGEAMGDFTPTFTTGSFSPGTVNATTVNAQNVVGEPTNTATSGANYGSSQYFGPAASFWNGSAAQSSVALQYMAPGSGTNPVLTDVFNIYPCPSTCNYQFDAPLTSTGPIEAVHFVGNNYPAPTIAAGAGAGTSPTIGFSIGYQSDTSGWISLTTGSSPTASAVVATITFGTAVSYPGAKCMLAPANAAANALTGAGKVYIPVSSGSTTTFTIESGSTALAASTLYDWTYTCTN
jgi:hypothetical protein